MAAKRREYPGSLTREQRSEIAAIAAKRDEEIGLSEMPEVIDWSEADVASSIVRRRGQ
jgi:hypothetical protein